MWILAFSEKVEEFQIHQPTYRFCLSYSILGFLCGSSKGSLSRINSLMTCRFKLQFQTITSQKILLYHRTTKMDVLHVLEIDSWNWFSSRFLWLQTDVIRVICFDQNRILLISKNAWTVSVCWKSWVDFMTSKGQKNSLKRKANFSNFSKYSWCRCSKLSQFWSLPTNYIFLPSI